MSSVQEHVDNVRVVLLVIEHSVDPHDSKVALCMQASAV